MASDYLECAEAELARRVALAGRQHIERLAGLWGGPRDGERMIFGSVCSGIEAASVAWHPLGWRAAFLSEIEPFPRAVLAHHYPGVPLHGDFTTIEAGQYEPIELLVGGTPCQSFSVAGLRGGLEDERGNLALGLCRLVDRLRPRWVVWENVSGVLSSGGGRDFGAILGALGQLGYGCAYRILDAQFFGVPQRRRRVFVVGCLGDWRRAAAVLFERESLRGDSAPRRQTGQGVAPTIASRPTGGGGLGTDFDCDGGLIAHSGYRDEHGLVVGFHPTQTPISSAECSPALGGTTGGMGVMAFRMAVRRLTPRECERLQGFPDDFTLVPYRGKPAADGPRYKALGNSMAVPVVRWIGERIQAVEDRR